MQLLDNQLILSASDLNHHIACRHLTERNYAYAHRDRTFTPEQGADATLLAQKGTDHELRYLASLKEEGREVIEIPEPEDSSLESLREVTRLTHEALRDGPDVIYQATFLHDNMRGHADFLFRVDRPSDLGDYSYEVADTKLARRAKPYFILQLCFYSELVQAVQGGEPPELIHVILGTNERHSFRLAEFSAYFRHVRDNFLAELADVEDWDTYPVPVDHCQLCRWRTVCDERRVKDDHLSLVAGLRRTQTELLETAGIRTLAALGTARVGLEVPGIRAPILDKLHDQAALQLEGRERGEPVFRLLPAEEKRGFERLPKPSRGDVFFDMEGDPWFEGGLEYLFGCVTVDTREPLFSAFWGRDRTEEKRALEQFIDFVAERRAAFPDLRVYHYAAYEVTALKRLAGAHATREEELDQLLRDQVFVDLYRVVRESLRISQPSYGLKKVEVFFMPDRETSVTDGNDSVIEFERWLESGEQAILDAIAEYNRDDCESTWRLREWLLERRAEAEAKSGPIPWFEPEPDEPSEERLAYREENEALIRALLNSVPDDLAEANEEQRALWLMAQLVEYHHREARPVWWAFFDRCDAEDDQLIRDADCIGGLEPDESVEPRPEKQSLLYRLSFPPQETKMRAGADAIDPTTGKDPGTIFAIDAEQGWLDLKRGRTRQALPFPHSLIPGGPYNTKEQQAALKRLASDLLENGVGLDGDYPAARQILLATHPRIAGKESGEAIDHEQMSIEELKEIAAELEDSYLFIQGPPGSGKTYRGARLVVDLVKRGNRVGVTSTSHKAIHNLLHEIESVADDQEVSLKGRKKHSDNPDSQFASKLPESLIESVGDNDSLSDTEVAVTGGTAWHYCREDTARLDYLFIDEAGQISLADALALATAARNVVLLGDPQQLPQVAQATHPGDSAVSVLQHLLVDHQTIPPERGVFLEDTYRLHPDVCGFISELMYDGRLRSAEGCERQRVDAAGEITGTGLRWLPVEHKGCEQTSPAEAERTAEAVAPLLDRATYTDSDGETQDLRAEDIMVVTPYNAQVRCLEERLPAGLKIGTVDKFQGQQAQVVFFSMATSSGDDILRNVEFLLSRNRLNVAISRARCLAVLVASPRLLDINAKSIDQMRLVNALCRFAETAAPGSTPSTTS